MKLTSKEEILTLLKGATFLASGGGGPFFLAKNIIEYYVDNPSSFNGINIIDPSEIKEDEWTCISANMAEPSKGSDLTPQQIVEPTINAFLNMQELMENIISKRDAKYKDFKKFTSLVPVEVGAINVATPLMVALKENLPVIDGDPSGRSVPTLELTTFATTQPVMPNMAASIKKDQFSVLSLENYQSLNTAYAKLINAGLIGTDTGLCLSPMQIKDVNNGSLVKGTLNDAYKIGKIMEENISSLEKIEKIKTTLSFSKSPRKTKHICTGKVIDYYTQSVNDNDLGYIKIQTDDKRVFTILIQNENIIGQYSDETGVYITGPDSICYLSVKNGPLENEYDIIDNVVIEMKFQQGEEINLHILAVETTTTILNNEMLMNNWENAYQTSNYFGTYNSKVWSDK